MPEAPHRPDRGQDVQLGVGRVQGHPVVPGLGQKIEVGRAVHAVQRGQIGLAGLAQRAHGAALQLAQHIVEATGVFVAGHQAAPEHFLAAIVQVVLGVVEDDHAGAEKLDTESMSLAIGAGPAGSSQGVSQP